ncbi:Uncharacterised protein [uncultured archaeon]|nr:Uncharacterised protein [uncultured archaeon]
MPELRELIGKIEQESAKIREKASANHWGKLSRRGFVYNIENMLPGIEDIYSLFQMVRNETAKLNEAEAPDVSEFLGELSKLITQLKRNREMEEARLQKIKSQGIESIAETVTVPELYSEMERKTLASLLKSSYLAERLRIFERKKEPLLQTKAGQRNILDLLAKREEEVQALRKKYEETRKDTFLGLVEKESSAETEKELNEISRSIESRTALMRKAYDSLKAESEQYQKQQLELGQRVLSVEELQAQMTGKTFELITMLKKERDYAKKMLIEIEQETIQLRNTYSKELLGLQEEKLSIKNTLSERYDKETAELRKENRDKAETIRHLQEIASERENRVKGLVEQNERLALIAKTVERHNAVREKMLSHENAEGSSEKEEAQKKPKARKRKK